MNHSCRVRSSVGVRLPTVDSRLTFLIYFYTEEAPKFPPRMESSWNLTWCRHCYGLTGKIMTRMQFNGPVRGMREVQSLSGGIWVVQNSTRLLCTSYDWFSIQSEKYLLQKIIETRRTIVIGHVRRINTRWLSHAQISSSWGVVCVIQKNRRFFVGFQARHVFWIPTECYTNLSVRRIVTVLDERDSHGVHGSKCCGAGPWELPRIVRIVDCFAHPRWIHWFYNYINIL